MLLPAVYKLKNLLTTINNSHISAKKYLGDIFFPAKLLNNT